MILAGGKSSRFGRDKALAYYEGRRMIERSAALLDELSLKPVVVTRKGAAYPFLKCATIYDKLEDQGPLGGIYTALSIFKNTEFLTLTCDMPALTKEVLSSLLTAHRSSGVPITLYSLSGKIQPFPGVYGPSAFPAVKDNLKRGNLALHGLIEAVPACQQIDWEGDPAVFSNINRQEDVSGALA